MSKPVWTIMEILNWTKQYFADKGVESPRLDAEVLLCAVLHCERIKLYVDFERPLTEAERSTYRNYVQRRANHEPIAYILGSKAFMDYEFKVTPATLVPRPETELLVEAVAKFARAFKPEGGVKILDLGTGSGAIIVSLLAMLPNSLGVGVDISPEALTVAHENATAIGVKERCGFICSDLFTRVPIEKKFDIIVSNPPYIPKAEIPKLARDVQKEPHGALDGGEDGLDFYRRIIAKAQDHLASEGLLAFEVGIYQAQQVAEMCKAAGFTGTAIVKDYGQIERMVFAVKEEGAAGKYEDLLLAISK